MLRPEFVCSLCILSKGSKVYNYVVVNRVIRCTCYITSTSYMYLTWMYLLILFMWQYRYMIWWGQNMSGHLVRLVLYAMYMYVYILFVRSNLSCVVRSEFVCSLCYIFYALELWYLPADVSNNFILIHVHLFFVHEFCCDYNIIVYWIKSDIHVLVLVCPYFVLDSVLYILCYIVLFCFCKANNFSGDGVSYFPTNSAVALWPFLVATPFV
jgi:hypothetical protein